MSAFEPTAEQTVARDLFTTGGPLVIEAGAGTGKTTALEIIGTSTTRHGQYLAFNRALVDDAKGRFPENVAVSTIHSLAFRSVGNLYAARLNTSRRMRNEDAASFLRLDALEVPELDGRGTRRLPAAFLAGHALGAVRRFCQSADAEPSTEHVAYIDGLDMPTEDGRRTYGNNRAVAQHLLPAVRRAWEDLSQTRGTLRYEHAHYLKTYERSGPVVPADFILLDEAQDVSPVMESIVLQQRDVQIVAVGDRAQSLYGFTGAVDSMSTMLRWPGVQVAYLDQSFRFGQPIADVANRLLDLLDTPLRLRGLESIASTVTDDEPLDFPHAVLCRTNATAVRRVLTEQQRGRRAALVGDGREVLDFAKGAEELQQRGHTSHRELACFSTWGAVQAFVSNDPNGDELRLMVRLVDEFGTNVIRHALGRLPREADAEIVVSTAHKAKGRAWPTVALADDFPADLSEPAEIRLLYVRGDPCPLRPRRERVRCPRPTQARGHPASHERSSGMNRHIVVAWQDPALEGFRYFVVDTADTYNRVVAEATSRAHAVRIATALDAALTGHKAA